MFLRKLKTDLKQKLIIDSNFNIYIKHRDMKLHKVKAKKT